MGTNGAAMIANTIQIGNVNTTTNVSGSLKTNSIISSGALTINSGTNLDTTINAYATAPHNVTIGYAGQTTQYIRGATVNLCENGGNVYIAGGGGSVSLGSAGSTTTVAGSIKLSNVLTSSITNDMTIANDQTAGRLVFADYTGRTGNVFIANKQSANIGGGDDGGVYIATDARSTLCTIRIGTAGYTTTSIRGGVNIADTGGTVNIGNTGSNVSINGTLRTNKLISTGTLYINETTGVETAINSNTTVAQNLTIGTPGYTTQYLRGATIYINEFGTGNTMIGNLTGSVNVSGSTIKQVVPCVGGGTVANTFGLTDNTTSLSTTYCRKSTTTLTALPCYTLLGPGIYTSGYFEIVISGSNQFGGGYAYKGFFGLNQVSSTSVTATAVSTLFSTGIVPTITFTGTNPLTLNITTALGNNSTSQTFIATLISYPTLTIDNLMYDYTVTAI
jgi:hypothetical protein